ncbi:DUF5518 domain-containing protein [Salinarchaeum laminariae]|uniref:DUF5518 domain-containing protein n=1 Tax=Salinarchaeum laminariae TaxID=869888 RepID=UPI0020BDCFEC|nr:hypothetical protein [Salinarchaeum laminariae]
MSSDVAEFRNALASSLTDGTFTAAVLWGALVGSILTIVEYNLIVGSGGPIQIRYSMFGSGAVAGALYAGPRTSAAKAGALAGSIPVVVLGPIAFVLLFVIDGLPTLNWHLDGLIPLFVLTASFFAVTGMVSGAVAAYAVSWVREQFADPQTTDSKSAS